MSATHTFTITLPSMCIIKNKIELNLLPIQGCFSFQWSHMSELLVVAEGSQVTSTKCHLHQKAHLICERTRPARETTGHPCLSPSSEHPSSSLPKLPVLRFYIKRGWEGLTRMRKMSRVKISVMSWKCY